MIYLALTTLYALGAVVSHELLALAKTCDRARMKGTPTFSAVALWPLGACALAYYKIRGVRP